MIRPLLPRRVLCIGNELCHDDGVAFIVARRLERCNANASILEAAELGLDCLDAFLGAAQVVIVDAVSTGARPGTCQVLCAPSALAVSCSSVGHALGVSSLLMLATQLGQVDSCRISIVGIEAEDLSPFGTTLSASVSASVPRAVALVLAELTLPLSASKELALAPPKPEGARARTGRAL